MLKLSENMYNNIQYSTMIGPHMINQLKNYWNETVTSTFQHFKLSINRYIIPITTVSILLCDYMTALVSSPMLDSIQSVRYIEALSVYIFNTSPLAQVFIITILS